MTRSPLDDLFPCSAGYPEHKDRRIDRNTQFMLSWPSLRLLLKAVVPELCGLSLWHTAPFQSEHAYRSP